MSTLSTRLSCEAQENAFLWEVIQFGVNRLSPDYLAGPITVHLILASQIQRPGTMAKCSHCKCHDPMWVPVYVHNAPLPIQLPACSLKMQYTIALGPCDHLGDKEETPDSLLHVHSAPAIADIWQWRIALFLSLPLSLSFSS